MSDIYLNLDGAKEMTYDAIVVGSGISGGWAAKELTEKGLKVLMLERGGDYKHIKDYDDRSAFEREHKGKPTFEDSNKRSDIINWMLNEQTAKSWVDETKEGKYTEVKPFRWVRAYRLGGRSTLWGRQSYRWSDLDFEANAKDGIAVDWPIRYKDLAPWYDHVEKFAGISGSLEGLSHLPDGQFQPPMPLNIVEKSAKKSIESKFENRKMIIGRVANLTQPLPGRVNCQFRNRCWEGCHFGGYFSTQSSTLPAAAATGNLSVVVNALVKRIVYDKDTKKATGVEVIDTATNQSYIYNSRLVFICASALNSAWVLMNSATDVWPDGLGSSSGELGHNVMDHHYNIGATGTIPGFEEYGEYGRRPNGFYIPRFANYGNDTRSAYKRGFGYQGEAYRTDWSRGANMKGIGPDFMDQISKPGPWEMRMTAFGEVLPDHKNKIFLDATVKDHWGLPVLSMDCEMQANELAMRKDMMQESVNMLEASGATNIQTFDGGHQIGHGIHEMGPARMGRDPKTSVLNGNNQVWDALNVFVTDGASMTSSSCVNPSLTYMALTARAVNFAVEELKKQNL
ncbi:MAG: GMC family oxidoreductase [Saprospiraceae bacterium]|nr:GMC family oxidoreductase [Saprospiraceae bacterium]